MLSGVLSTVLGRFGSLLRFVVLQARWVLVLRRLWYLVLQTVRLFEVRFR